MMGEAASDSMIIDDEPVGAKNHGKQPATQIDNLPWVEKYRPVQLVDLISHKGNIREMKTK